MFLSRESNFLLIKDTSNNSARHFMQALASSYSKKGTNVKYLSYDLPIDRISKRFSDDDKFCLYDAFSNLYNVKDSNIDYLSCSNIFQQFTSTETTVVVIDSLYMLLSENSIDSFYRAIHSFLNKERNNAMLVVLMHTDSHSDEEVCLMESLATKVLELISSSGKDTYCFNSLSKPACKKVTKESIECRIDGDVISTSKIKDAVPQPNVSQTGKRPDPTANLTFNLKLQNVEKEIREKLQLPYTKAQSEIVVSNSDIFNEDDFYDEEDPDDDLDI